MRESNGSYKYEVAFSFLQEDEAIAYDLSDKLQDRLSTFIYSKRQKELGGTDGEKRFSNVFYEEARIVVVLYRDGWGNTPWTNIEETAIKNRAFGKGWEFLLIVNLDSKAILPSWVPKPYIWLDYQRFKSTGTIAVIEHKVKEVGGNVRQDTIQSKAERLKRRRAAENERAQFLRSSEAIKVANQEVREIVRRLKEIKPIIEDPATHLTLATSEREHTPVMYEFGYRGYFLCFNNSKPFEYEIDSGILRVSIYEKSGEPYSNYKETTIRRDVYKFDRSLLGINGWVSIDALEDFISTDELINIWVKNFITGIEERRKK